MKWYWAILIYLAGLILGIILLIACHKLLEDEENKKHFDKSIKNALKDNEDEKI